MSCNTVKQNKRGFLFKQDGNLFPDTALNITGRFIDSTAYLFGFARLAYSKSSNKN